MRYKQNTEYCFGKGRLEKGDVSVLLSEAKAHLAAVLKEKDSGQLPILGITESAELSEINELASAIKKNFDNLIVLGTGGSILCGRALSSMGQTEYSNTKPRIIYMQNIDPHTVGELFASIDISRTAFLAISKSGTSIETLTQLTLCLERAKAYDIPSRFFSISMPGDNPLRRISAKFGIRTYDHDPNIGGRFSIFANVGLVPTAVSGLDIAAIRKGGAKFMNEMAELAVESASIHVALMRKNIWQNVLMTYPDRLEHFNIWYRQIWAESIGKNGTGSTPIKALGTIDQHSQMQIYLGGRKDKFYNFITTDFSKQGDKLVPQDDDISFLAGKKLGEVINAEQLATIATLSASNRPVRVIEMATLDEENLGALAMHLMLETIITAKLLGVNPYDQPAVEDGKIRAREILKS